MMSNLHQLLLIGFAVVMAIIPYWVIRFQRRLYLALDVGTWALIFSLAWMGPRFGLGISENFAFVLILALKLGTFFVFGVVGGVAENQRWGPIVAAIFAGAIYLIVIPHQLQWPIDGDEPYYLLTSESILHDFDLDLANQFRDIDQSVVDRPDLRPHPGEPVGEEGERVSRYEPTLPLLLIPGRVLGGLFGAVATMALFGALLMYSTIRFLEEEGISHRAAFAVYPLIAFGPPVLFYATRMWPEIPAAWCLVEALRAIRSGKERKMILFLAAMSLLKLRFAALALGLVTVVFFRWRTRFRTVALAAALFAVPLLIAWWITGNPLRLNSIRDLELQAGWKYARGFFGLLLDGQTGLLFQAPLWLISLASLFRWKRLPEALKLGFAGSSLYLFLLLPRVQWHGGWSPPLRYLTVFAPLFALAAGWMVERMPSIWLGVVALATTAISIHGVAWPYRLFHIENGESTLGEALSRTYHADFSRLIPSLIRTNAAAWWWGAALIVTLGLGLVAVRRQWMRKISPALLPVLLALLFAIGAGFARRPGSVVQFEDAHVTHRGGMLSPPLYTMMRFLYRGGWVLNSGDEVSFLYSGGPSRLEYASNAPVEIRIGRRNLVLPSTAGAWTSREVDLPSKPGRVALKVRHGSVRLDRIEAVQEGRP